MDDDAKIKVKEALNTNLDKDVAEFYKTRLKGNASRIVNNLSRAFKEAVAKDPSVISDALYGNFEIIFESQKKRDPKNQ